MSGTTPGKNYDEFYRRAVEQYGVDYIKGMVGKVWNENAEKNPDVKFIAIDVGSGDFEGAKAGYKLPSNLTSFIYQEELPGYMAGYAAVKEGYTKLGFLGGMAVPAVVRYGYGFVQGANDAARQSDEPC